LLHLIPTQSGEDPRGTFQQFVENGVSNPDQDFRHQLKSNPVAFGPDSFVQEIKLRYENALDDRTKKEDVVMRQKKWFIPSQQVLESTNRLYNFKPENLQLRVKGRMERCFAALALQKYAGQTQREIADTLNLTTGAAISVLLRKYRNEPQILLWLREMDLIFKG
jgi:hypothetical protein